MRSYFSRVALGLALLTAGCSRNPRDDFNYANHEVYGAKRVPADDFNSSEFRSAINKIITTGQEKQFIGFKDQHNYPSHYEFLAFETTMKALADAGYKHIFLEIPLYGQKYFDEFSEGKISRQIFNGIIETLGTNPNKVSDIDHERIQEARADIVARGKKYGIKIHCVDVDGILGDITPKQRELAGKVAELRAEAMKVYLLQHPEYFRVTSAEARTSILVDIQDQVISSKLTAQEALEFQQLIQTMVDDTPQKVLSRWKTRFAKDPETAAYIASLAGREKGVVLYGKNHFQFMNMGIANSLGRDRTLVVDLWDSPELMQQENISDWMKLARLWNFKGIEMADVGIILFPARFVTNEEIVKRARDSGNPTVELR